MSIFAKYRSPCKTPARDAGREPRSRHQRSAFKRGGRAPDRRMDARRSHTERTPVARLAPSARKSSTAVSVPARYRRAQTVHLSRSDPPKWGSDAPQREHRHCLLAEGHTASIRGVAPALMVYRPGVSWRRGTRRNCEAGPVSLPGVCRRVCSIMSIADNPRDGGAHVEPLGIPAIGRRCTMRSRFHTRCQPSRTCPQSRPRREAP